MGFSLRENSKLAEIAWKSGCGKDGKGGWERRYSIPGGIPEGKFGIFPSGSQGSPGFPRDKFVGKKKKKKKRRKRKRNNPELTRGGGAGFVPENPEIHGDIGTFRGTSGHFGLV